MRKRAKRGVSLRFLITFQSSYQLLDRNLKKTKCDEFECHSEMENNKITKRGVTLIHNSWSYPKVSNKRTVYAY